MLCWRSPWNYNSSTLGKAIVSVDEKGCKGTLVSLLLFASGASGDEICYIIVDDLGYLTEEDVREKSDRLRIRNSFGSDIEFGNPIRQILHYPVSPFPTGEDIYVINCGVALYFIRGRFLNLRHEEILIRLRCEDGFAITIAVACQDQNYDFAVLDLKSNLTIYRFTSDFNAYHWIRSVSMNYLLYDSPFSSWQLAFDVDMSVLVKNHLTVLQYQVNHNDINVVCEASSRESFIQILPLDQVPSTFALLSDTTLLVYSSATGQNIRREHYRHPDSRPFLRSVNCMENNLLLLCSAMDSVLTIFSFTTVQGVMAWNNPPVSLKISPFSRKEIFSAEVKTSKTRFGRVENECLVFHTLDRQTLSTQVLTGERRDEILLPTNGDIAPFKITETMTGYGPSTEEFLCKCSSILRSHPSVPNLTESMNPTPELTRIGRPETGQGIKQGNNKLDFPLRDMSEQYAPLTGKVDHDQVTHIAHLLHILTELNTRAGIIYHLTPNLESEPATEILTFMQVLANRYLKENKEHLSMESSSDRSMGVVQMFLHEGMAALTIRLNYPDRPSLPTLSKYTSHSISPFTLSGSASSILQSWPITTASSYTSTTTAQESPLPLPTDPIEGQSESMVNQGVAPVLIRRKQPPPAKKQRRTAFQ